MDSAFSETVKTGSRWARFQMDPEHLDAFYSEEDTISVMLGMTQPRNPATMF